MPLMSLSGNLKASVIWLPLGATPGHWTDAGGSDDDILSHAQIQELNLMFAVNVSQKLESLDYLHRAISTEV